jgi:hypothetical protein
VSDNPFGETPPRLVDEKHMDLLGRADRDLPPQLRHDAIVDVARCSTPDRMAYRVTFEGERLPVGYRERIDDSVFAITDASVEHVRRDGLLGLVGATEPRLAVLLATDAPELSQGDRP